MWSGTASVSERDWLLYIDDMIGFAEKVIAYTAAVKEDEFHARGMTYDAVLRNLELIGEAATHIPEDIRQQHVNIPWRKIIATRNRLIHGYLGIDDETLWNIATGDIVDLLSRLMALREGKQ